MRAVSQNGAIFPPPFPSRPMTLVFSFFLIDRKMNSVRTGELRTPVRQSRVPYCHLWCR